MARGRQFQRESPGICLPGRFMSNPTSKKTHANSWSAGPRITTVSGG